MVTYLLSMRSFAGTSGPLAVLSVGAEGVLMDYSMHCRLLTSLSTVRALAHFHNPTFFPPTYQS